MKANQNCGTWQRSSASQYVCSNGFFNAWAHWFVGIFITGALVVAFLHCVFSNSFIHKQVHWFCRFVSQVHWLRSSTHGPVHLFVVAALTLIGSWEAGRSRTGRCLIPGLGVKKTKPEYISLIGRLIKTSTLEWTQHLKGRSRNGQISKVSQDDFQNQNFFTTCPFPVSYNMQGG